MIVEIDRKTDEIVVYDHDGMGRKELYRSTDAAAAISWALEHSSNTTIRDGTYTINKPINAKGIIRGREMTGK